MSLPALAPLDRARRRTLAPVLALAVALVAGLVVPATPAAAATARARTDQETWLEWQVADALGAARQSPRSVDPGAPESAVRPLTGWSDLRDFARDWSDDMAARRMMSHNPAFADGYCCWSKAGEVLAKLSVGTDASADDLAGAADRAVQAWFASAPHRSAILDGAFDQLGVGVTVDHAAGTIWVAVDLRQTAGSPPGGVWYRPGDPAPPTPGPGWACDSDAAPFGATNWPLPPSSLVRRNGDDRVGTSLAVSRGVSDPGTVLLASASTPTDALASAGLAGTLGAPVLLTDGGRLDGRVADRLRQWRPDRIALVGGTRVLTSRVASDAARAVPSAAVERLQGRDRYATAAALATELAGTGGDTGRAVLALGDHPQPDRAWADAVSVSGLAASHDHPVLLTAPGSLPGATREALRRLSPSVVLVPGGPSGVSDGVLDQVRAALPDVRLERLAGAGRYETSRAVVARDQALRPGPTRRVVVVDGRNWPDALTAGPAAARDGAVLVLVDGGGAGRGPGLDHVRDLSDRLQRLQVTLVGGRTALSATQASAIRDRLHCL